MTITLVAAVSRNGVIGVAGGLPWHLPEDLRHFREVTMGHALVMGRRTFDAIGRPLPGRRTIVVTKDPAWRREGVEVAGSLDEAWRLAGPGPVMVAGGGQIYRQAMDRADRLELTIVDRDVIGDTFFPAVDPARWRLAARDQRDGYAFDSYVRRPGRLDGSDAGTPGDLEDGTVR